MKEKANIESLFTPQQCISAEGIQRYISGDLDQEALQLVLDHADSCSLCKQALEGALDFEGSNQYAYGIERLQKKWNARQVSRPGLNRATLAGVLAVAASILILVGLHFTIRNQRSARVRYLAQRMYQGNTLEEALTGTEPLISLLTRDAKTSGSATENRLRKQFRETLPDVTMEIPVAMLEETKIFAYASDSITDRSMEEQKGARARLHYPVRAIPIEISRLESGVSHTAPELASMATRSSFPELDKESINGFQNYIDRNLRYPRLAKEKQIGGKVYVQFAINTQGQLTNIEILKSSNSLLDSELLRVLKDSPKLKPGIFEGRPVEVALVMPVDFRLHE